MKLKRNFLFTLMFLSFQCAMAQGVAHVTYQASNHYNEKVAEFENLPPIQSTDIVMLGNSLTEFGGDWSEKLGRDNVVNRGIIGDTSTGIYHRLCQILPAKPKAIFLLCGTNDVSHNLTPKQVFDDICRVVEKIKKDSPTTKIYLESLLPFVVGSQRWKTLEGKEDCMPAINAMLMDYCKANDVGFVNLYPRFVKKGTKTLRLELSLDELHINRLGYKIWAHEIAPIIKKLQHK